MRKKTTSKLSPAPTKLHWNATERIAALGQAPKLWHNVVISFAGASNALTIF